jgi:NAD(P)-dependent dehydrogenase (short-subunit alcohol dehydrogenase family)
VKDQAAKSRIVITGSTRGLGLRMAREFLSRGCSVMVSGRTAKAVDSAAARLKGEVPEGAVRGHPCDAGDYGQVESLWTAAVGAMGGVDHWINNAGIGQAMAPMWELPPDEMDAVIRTDVLGVLYGARVAMRGMAAARKGMIWFMEGHGSDGRIMKGLSVYGAAKRSLRYAANALAVEAEGTGIRIGTLSPGIMITDFTLSRLNRNDAEEWKRTRAVFNILADTPETVAAFLVPRILAAKKNGTHIAWLTNRKIMMRFMTALFLKRSVLPD